MLSGAHDSNETPQFSTDSTARPVEISHDPLIGGAMPNPPPRKLMGLRLKQYSWLLIALILGAIIAYFLVGLAD